MKRDEFLNKLRNKNPENLNKYDYSKLPETFLSGSEKIIIKCKKHGDFEQLPSAHLFGAGCPECGMYVKRNSGLMQRNFINKSIKLFGDRFDYSKTIYDGKNKPVTITCKKHGDITLLAIAHLSLKYGCGECGEIGYLESRKKSVFDKCKKIHGDRYSYELVDFKTVNDKVDIICKLHGVFRQNLYSHSKGYNCPSCVVESGCISFDEFIRRSKEVHGNKYTYHQENYTKLNDITKITCPIHGDFFQRAYSHIEGYSCGKCNLRKTKEQFIKGAIGVHGNKYDYSLVDYITNKIKVNVICPRHGSFWVRPDGHIFSMAGCPCCKESKGETYIREFLEDLGIKFIQEYKFEQSSYRFDFFLPEQNILIEFHGKQHYEAIDMFGGEASLKECKRRDEEKVKLAFEKKTPLIVLEYFHFYKGKLKQELILRLKGIHKYWLVVGDKIVTYDDPLELYREFNIDPKINVRDLVVHVAASNPDLKVLF